MASKTTVQSILRELASIYGWSGDRYRRAVPGWESALRNHGDEDLIEAKDTWVATQNRAPTPADLISTSTGGGRATQELPDGCPDCDWTGWRHLARKWQTEYGPRQAEYSAACDCPLGVHYQRQPDVLTHTEQLERWRRDPQTIQTWSTDRHHQDLPDEARYTPEQLARVQAGRLAYRKAHPHGPRLVFDRDRRAREPGLEHDFESF